MNSATIFYNKEGHSLASTDGLLPIPLYKGMKITILGDDATFEVAEWEYYHGNSDENSELRIIIEKQPSTKWEKIPFIHI